MTALDLELSPTLLDRLTPLLDVAADEWVRSDVAEGTASRTVRAFIAAGLDGLVQGGTSELRELAEILTGLATVFPSAGVVLTMHAAVQHMALSSGTEAQRARVLRPGSVWGFGAAPPIDRPRASVERDDRGAVLRGSLRRVSGAGVVDGLAVLVPYGDRSAVLLVETDRDGVRVEPSWGGVGLRASSTRAVHFDGVRVDKHDVVAVVDGAHELPSWETAMIGLLAVCGGIARRAALEALERVRSDSRGLVRASSHEAIGTVLNEAVAALAVTRAAAARARNGAPDLVGLMGSKLATAAMAERAVAAARAVIGMDGFETPHPLERLSRDALGVKSFFPTQPIAIELMLGMLDAGQPSGGGAPRGGGGPHPREASTRRRDGEATKARRTD